MDADKEKCGVCRKTEDDDSNSKLWTECSNVDCKQWFHNECAGILEEITSETDWFCHICELVAKRLSAVQTKQGSKTGEESNNIDDDESQLNLIAKLIKDKEELCELQQKRLDLMDRLSQRESVKHVERWLKVKAKTCDQVGESTINVNHDSHAKNVSSNSVVCGKSRHTDDVANNDLAFLMKRQMQLMSQQYLVDLPEFDGNPDVWAIFYQQYITTTEKAGFDDSFNLMRLRKCLKGEARQAVAGIMALPNCLPDVMKILEKRFGNQDVIVKTKIQKLSIFTPPNENKPQTVRNFYEFLLGLYSTLLSLKAENYLYSPQTLDMVIEKLPLNLKRQWIRHVRHLKETPILLGTFLEWFEPIYDCAIECDLESGKSDHVKRNSSRVNVNKEATEVFSSTKSKSCSLCRKQQHKLVECSKFKMLSCRDRWQHVRQQRLCFCCLLSKHRHEDCNDRKKCEVDQCANYHHHLLHYKDQAKKNDAGTQAEIVLSAKVSSIERDRTLFRSIPVILSNPENGRQITTWAFLDEGSSPTMLLDSVAKDLNLTGEVEELCTTWTDDSVRKEVNSRRVKLTIRGINQPHKYILKDVRTVSKLNLPMPSDTDTLRQNYSHLRDIDIPSYKIAQPTILIGLAHAKLGLMYEIREGRWNEPIASRTRLGWIIHGKEVNSNSKNYVCHVCECGQADDFGTMMREFYSTETFGVKVVENLVQAKDVIRANFILESTTRKLNNEYETGLLWRRDDIPLPSSRNLAEKRLLCFEQKLERNGHLKAAVQAKMQEHIEKGYLVPLSSDSIVKDRHWFLPIFAVVNPNKTFKPRLVFDAAAKNNGISLNDMLLKGSEMLSSLFGIILRFRLRKFAVSADIAEMFHRVKIIERDQQYQLVLWRNCNKKLPMAVFKMTRMTFGATCSPCSAHYVKDQNAKLFSNIYPRAVEAIIRNHYVDNLLDCYDTENEAIEVAKQILHIHRGAGFLIRDWVSNSRLVETEMNSQVYGDCSEVNMNFMDETSLEKVLGMYWKVDEDVFVFKVNVARVNPEIIQHRKLPTKREVLRIVMSQFDPLGILSPLIIHAKILMQEIWISGVDWDDYIPLYLEGKWHAWLDALVQVSTIQVSRWYFHDNTNTGRTILHMFADASEEAFAGVCYLQLRTEDGQVCVSLVASKSRVAPKKTLSIPRLELQAAVLSTRLKDSIMEGISIPIDEVVCWTDSKTVLGWIRSKNRKYASFVSHRISEILDSTTVQQWRWVPTKQNIADQATRLTSTPTVSKSWLKGPDFLHGDIESWPVEVDRVSSTDAELKRIEEFHCVQSSLIAIVDVNRFIRSEKQRRQSKTGRLVDVRELISTVPALNKIELDSAEKLLFKIVQQEEYANEIKSLESAKVVSRKSIIYNLNPSLDEEGILRLTGRLEAAPSIINDNIRRPIILSPGHRITDLLIDAVHRKFHHLNKECIVNELRQYLWIPKIRVRVNKVVKDCFYCKSRLAKPRIPMMAPLPIARLSPYEPAFSFTGIDYFGPIEITVGRHHEKRWGVLFVCLTMRAIHLELAGSLDTNSAVMCIRNFICRRGTPTEFISDNGTNLRAAERELREAVQKVDMKYVQDEISIPFPNATRTKWSFIPPGAPHFGGSWERMVQIVKKSLYIILKDKYPKEEALRSALIEIENLVNSRPLYYVPNEVDMNEAITPNHLLKGSGKQVVPLPGEFDSRKQWRVAQSLATEFWGRWLNEYLPTISRRTKWHAEVDAIQVGAVVLIIDEHLQRGEWKKGVVSKVFPSTDGRIRAAEVKTEHGKYIRPVAKLAVILSGKIL